GHDGRELDVVAARQRDPARARIRAAEHEIGTFRPVIVDLDVGRPEAELQGVARAGGAERVRELIRTEHSVSSYAVKWAVSAPGSSARRPGTARLHGPERSSPLPPGSGEAPAAGYSFSHPSAWTIRRHVAHPLSRRASPSKNSGRT